jgi:hypothetical protein
MSLAAWQEQTVQRLEAPDCAGVQVTAHIRRWWRSVRLQSGAPLTLAALGADASKRVCDYLDEHPPFTTFYHHEAEAFIVWLAHQPVHPHVRALAAFETAMLRLRRDPGDDHVPVYIRFQGCAYEVLHAAARGTVLPVPTDAESVVEVGRAVPGGWRVHNNPND